MKYALSSENSQIYYQLEGKGSTALLFVHGWMGNSDWWKAQRNFFMDKYMVVAMDLPGHGNSEPLENGYSAKKYADAIVAVAEKIPAENLILVGHSMSGAYVLEAAIALPKVKSIIVVDTLKDLDQLFTHEQAEQFMYSHYRADFKTAVEQLLPQYLFASGTPVAVKERLQQEFLKRDAETAIQLLEPLYKMDVPMFAQKTTVPVRAINSDYFPTSVENNKKYFKDYESVSMGDTGHYPMLENPEKFNQILENIL